MIAGILFDKDGTLADFRRTWLPAYHGLAQELAGLAIPDGNGGSIADLAQQLLARLGYHHAAASFDPGSPLLWATNDDLACALADQPELRHVDTIGIVRDHLEDAERYPPMPVGDLSGLFTRLRGRGLVLGIATMDSTRSAEELAAACGLDDHLAFVAGCDAGYGHKPSAGMVEGFCRAAGLAPSEVAVVGDTPVDFAMARNAKAGAAVAVLTGALTAPELALFADAVVADVHAVDGWLDATGRLATPTRHR